MVKNALQAQLLKAGLVDVKQAKKASKQVQHAKKTGENQQEQLKQALATAQQEKVAKDNQLNTLKQQQLEEKTLRANIIQMIKQYKITDFQGDIAYQFIDENKIKKQYIHQQAYNGLVAGSLCIAKIAVDDYAFLPKPLADKIEQKCTGYILSFNSQSTDQSTDEDDPYAAYVIPDDLMW